MPGFPGFDRSDFPGMPVMNWLKANTNLGWCGFYLAPAPSHDGASWMPQRPALAGWGLAPIYVGQQTVGHGSFNSSGPQGVVDGNDAAKLMLAAQFPPGHCVYLDLENGPLFTHAQHDYVSSWVDTVTKSGFQAGIYCSHLLAEEVHQLRPAARMWVFKVSTVALHDIPGTNFSDSHPSGSGFPASYIWQHNNNGLISVPPAVGQKLQIDLDTALTPDPGA